MTEKTNDFSFSHVVFPIVKIEMVNDKSQYREFLGTGFFIGDKGYFLTAKHVLNEKVLSDLKENELIAIQLYLDNFRLFPISKIQGHGASNIDLAIGFSPQCIIKEPNFFKVTSESAVHGWADVYSYGYPEFLLEDIPKEGQFLKGYILRETQKGLPLGTLSNAPSCYALNYSIPLGMSGSPVFVRGINHPLVGICLGSYETVTTLWENTFYEEPNKKVSEKKERVIENGIALKIVDYLDWKIDIADGKLFRELF